MLDDLDRSVAAFLSPLLPAGTAVRFDPPATLWADQTSLLNAFLYDIREARTSSADGMLTRGGDGRATGWRPPVRRYRVSYLLTAWPGSDQNEHELLGLVLSGCAALPAIPEHCLHGVLAEAGQAGEPVLLECAAADRAIDLAGLWQFLGVRARTAIDLVAVAPVIPCLSTEFAPAVRSVGLGVRRGQAQPSAAAARPPRPEQHITEA